MKRAIQGICALLTLSLVVAISPTDATKICPLTIANTPVEVEDTTLILSQYDQQADSNQYVQSQYYKLTVPINRVSMGADLIFTAMEDDTTIFVEVLTDLNGDGHYEWLDMDNQESRTTISPSGELVTKTDETPAMVVGERRTISTAQLRTIGSTAEQNRTADGATPLQGLTLTASGDLIYCVTTQGAQESLSYYFALDRNLDRTTPTTLLGAGAFVDVPSWSWYWGAVDWATRSGIIHGETVTHFNPDNPTTRGALMQVLYLQAGAPNTPDATFSDVKEGSWYQDAISWGYHQGLVTGNGNGTFTPEDTLTREQLAVVLYNSLNQAKDETTDLAQFEDGHTVSPWAQKAMSWALGQGILEEMDGGQLNPQDTISRASLAVVLQAIHQMG